MASEASAVMVTLADFSGGGVISDNSAFIHTIASNGNLDVLQGKLRSSRSSDQSQPDFLCFVVGPPLKPLPDQRKRTSTKSLEPNNIIPRVAEIQIDQPVGPTDIVFDRSMFVLTKAKETQVRDAVERLKSNELLSLDDLTKAKETQVRDAVERDENGAYSLVLVRKDFKRWLTESFKKVFKAVLAQKEWKDMVSECSGLVSHTSVTPQITTTVVPPTTSVATVTVKPTKDVPPVDKITENYTLMLLESMVADFTLGARFHCGNVSETGPVTCLDHLLLKLWTFAHWVYCERFCGYNHANRETDVKFKEDGCPRCRVKNSSMSFFWYYSRFSREKEGDSNRVVNTDGCWTTISQDILKAVLKLPRENDALYRGMKPPLEGVSFRIVKKDMWRSDAENPQAHDEPSLPLLKPREAHAVDEEIKKKSSSPAAPQTAADFQQNRSLFLEGDSRGLSGVHPGDLLLMDNRISSFSSDPGTAMMRYSSIQGQRYPSTVIIIEDGFGLYNQFSIVPNVRELRDAELQVCPKDEFVVTAVQKDALWRQRFVESGSGVEPVWSLAQYHISPEVGVAAVPFISTSIDPTEQIEVHVFKDKCYFQPLQADCANVTEILNYTKDGISQMTEKEGKWWIPLGSRRISHIVKKEGHSEEIVVRFHSTRAGVEELEFVFKGNDRQQYPPEIQTVRDTLVLKWLINLNTSPGHMLHTLPQIGPDRRDQILTLRQREPFRDLDHFDERLGFFPREGDRGSKGVHRHGIQALVTFGSVATALPQPTDSSFGSPAKPFDPLEKSSPPTVQKPHQSHTGGSFGSPFIGISPSPPTVLLADGRRVEFCLMGNKETARKALEEVLSRLGCNYTLEKVKRAAGGGPDGINRSIGGLDMPSLQRLLSHFRLCEGKARCQLICMLRELLTSFGIPY